MDNFASLSCFRSSTEEGLPEKKRSIRDSEKMQAKQSQAFRSCFLFFLLSGDTAVSYTDRMCGKSESDLEYMVKVEKILEKKMMQLIL